MRGTNVDKVIRCIHIHLTVFPHFMVARTDHGPEFSSKFTEFLSTHSIHHLWSIPTRSQVNGQVEISIRIIRTMINRIVDSSAMHRTQWIKLLPFITNSINKSQLTAAQGLTRSQLLFSPYIQHCGLPAEGLFLVQETLYKKILNNRQKILLQRQEHMKTDNNKLGLSCAKLI